jgi:hypothetical protein
LPGCYKMYARNRSRTSANKAGLKVSNTASWDSLLGGRRAAHVVVVVVKGHREVSHAF